MLRALRTALRTTEAPTNLPSFLTQVLHIASAIKWLPYGIKNVILQVFQPSVPRGSTTTNSLSRNRQSWNFMLHLSNAGNSAHTTSKPWTIIKLPELYIAKLCRTESPLGALDRLNVQFGLHLRPSIFHGNLQRTDDASASAFGAVNVTPQSLIDHVTEATLSCLAQKVFASEDEVLLNAENAVLSSLRSSPLAILADFGYLELEALNPKKERFVANVLLNADGTKSSSRTQAATLPNDVAFLASDQTRLRHPLPALNPSTAIAYLPRERSSTFNSLHTHQDRYADL